MSRRKTYFYCSFEYTVILNLDMRVKKLAKIHSGHLSRRKVEAIENGTYFLLQARDVDSQTLAITPESMIRFNPALSPKDIELKDNDILFMARGSKNYAVLFKDLPEQTLAAACFFVVRVTDSRVLPGYLFWYLNQEIVKKYLERHSGRGVHMPVVRRGTLESIDIPLPPVEVQQKIIELSELMRKEQELAEQLAEKRRQVITSVCFQAINTNQ